MNEPPTCPKCQTAMLSGFTVAPRGILWRDKDSEPFGVLNLNLFSALLLSHTMSFSLFPEENKAWTCPHCSFVLIDHSQFLRSKKQKR